MKLDKKLLTPVFLILILIPLTIAQECEIFSDDFDSPDETKWIQKENFWSFENGVYSAAENPLAIMTTANTEDLSDFIVEANVLPSNNYFGISVKSPINNYPMVGFYLSSDEIFLAAFPETIYPLLAFTKPISYKITPNQWYKAKLKSENNIIQSKIWPISEPEPQEWMLTLTLSEFIAPTFTSGKVALHGSNTKFDNFKITDISCQQPITITPQECTEEIFPKKSFMEIKDNCFLINPSKAGFYRFIYTYDSNNNVNIIEPSNCGSYTCKFPYAFTLSSNIKKIAVYNNKINGWVEKNV